MPAPRSPSVAVRRRRAFVGVVGVLSVVALGFTFCGPATTDAPRGDVASPAGGSPPGPTPSAAVMPPAYLVWMSGGFPADFRTRVRALDDLQRTVVVAGDTLWMTGSHDADGSVVDDPTPPFAVPIDAFAVTPAEYGPFLPSDGRDRIVRALGAGEGVLGRASAALRGIGVGGSLTFEGRTVKVGAVVPDDAVGWSELMVSREVGAGLGITDERYLLAQVDGAPSEDAFADRVGGLLPAGTPLRVVAPGGSTYMRVGSGVNPPVVLKQALGEFTAHPQADPAYLTEDPAWVQAHIQTRTVPLLGRITCNRLLFPPLIAALEDVQRAGLGDLIHSNAGCWNARTVARSPTAPPSNHAYGAAVDINAPENAYGATPTMDPRIVRIFRAHGFTWGGAFLIPDGMHFEYGKPDPTA